MKPKTKEDIPKLFDELFIFKCLGCEYYLSGRHTDNNGNYRSCEKDCTRTVFGAEQVNAEIKNITDKITEHYKEIAKLSLQKSKVEQLLRLLKDNN
jgi:hypothetical protein